jgi:hypothetical protein
LAVTQEREDVEELQPVPDSYVPVIKMKVWVPYQLSHTEGRPQSDHNLAHSRAAEEVLAPVLLLAALPWNTCVV